MNHYNLFWRIDEVGPKKSNSQAVFYKDTDQIN